MRNALLLLCIGFFPPAARAQLSPGLSISGYADAYMGYYTDSLPSGDFQKFPTYAPRSGQIGLNIAQLAIVYKADKVRGTLTLHYGDIPQSAWSPDFRVIQEANAGVHLSKKLWLDAGFFRTHIGAEGLYPKENITSSIAIPTYCEPYYEAGLKLTYQVTPKLEARLYLLNGYNIFVDNNRKKSVGMLATYAFNDSTSLVYANYVGDDSPDSATKAHTRFYNNVSLYYSKGSWRVTMGLDYAIQQNASLSTADGTANMLSGLIAVRYRINPRWGVYLRGEYMKDGDGFMMGTYKDVNSKVSGLTTTGGTLGMEHKLTAQSYIRIEGRVLQTDDVLPLFYWDKQFTNHRYEAVFSMGVWF